MKKQENNQELSDQVSEYYKKFFAKFQEIETVPVEEWKVVHILAFICKRYEEYYKLKYTFKFNNPAPSKSSEIYQIKRMANMLTANPKILKEYIEWVFKYKIIDKKKRITSLAYFVHQDIINEYKFKFLLANKPTIITRNDKLASNVASICTRHGFNIKTYAELAFVNKMPNQDGLFNELKSIGFNVDILEKIS